jgi:hypothetical protein
VGRPLILNYLGKRKEKLKIEGKRVSRFNTQGIIGHHCCPDGSCQRQYWSTETEG